METCQRPPFPSVLSPLAIQMPAQPIKRKSEFNPQPYLLTQEHLAP